MTSCTTPHLLRSLIMWMVVGLLSLQLMVVESKVVTSAAQAVGDDVRGAFKYYYDDSVPSPCETVVFIGVGTAMRTTDYSMLANDIVEGHSVVVVIVDDFPGWIQKQNPERYAKSVNAIAGNIQDRIHACHDVPEPSFIVGGHSGSGEGAIRALPDMLAFSPIGFVGLAPYQVAKTMKIGIPALFWGFSKRSCSVTPSRAAELGYEISDTNHRVLYQVQTHHRNTVTGGPHCIFTDKGCVGMCFPKDQQWIRPAVGRSINIFIEALNNPSRFKRETFEAAFSKSTKMFFNQDMIGSSAGTPSDL